MDFNSNFPITDGYPRLKVYNVFHWYGNFYEFEIWGVAIASDYKAFFQQLTDYSQSKFYENVQEVRSSNISGADVNYRRPYQIRFISKNYNEEFIIALGEFLKSIQDYIKPRFIIFGEAQSGFLRLLDSLSIAYKLRPTEDAYIEKIEWYWSGMHPNVSPRIRFDKLNGRCVILGSALGTPLYPNYREPISSWFTSYLNASDNNDKIKVELLPDYFDMIGRELKRWAEFLEERFSTDKIEFTWYFPEDKEARGDDYQNDDFESYISVFQPFSATYKTMDWERFLKYIDEHYSRFNEV